MLHRVVAGKLFVGVRAGVSIAEEGEVRHHAQRHERVGKDDDGGVAGRDLALQAADLDDLIAQAKALDLAAAKAAQAEQESGKKKLLDNGDASFVNPKEKMYDKFPLTVHQLDILIGILFALIVLFLVLGFTHTSFFGLFGG